MCALGAWGATLALPRGAHATTALALSLEKMVERSSRVVVGTPVEHSCHWAWVGGSERIVTWTRVLQDADLLTPDDQRDEVLVMTLGGKVGSLRQKVAGEAALRTDERCVVFLSGKRSLTSRVVGMAQGHFPLETADEEVLTVSRDLPHLVGKRPQDGPVRERAAIDALRGLPLRHVRQMLVEAR